MMRNTRAYNELMQNPPTNASALSSVNWIQKIIGVIDAGLHGDLHKNPTQMLDGFIAKELEDQRERWKGRVAGLEREKTMFERFYDLSKDETEAEISTLGH